MCINNIEKQLFKLNNYFSNLYTKVKSRSLKLDSLLGGIFKINLKVIKLEEKFY